MKVRSLDQLSQSISDCLSWRKHELKNLQSYYAGIKQPLLPLVKGSLLLTYAHWEGGVKDVALRYLRHVEQQKKLRKDLSSNFLALESIPAIRQAAASNQLLLYQQAIDHIRFNLEHRYRLPNISLIDTESNLSSLVLKNILLCIGLTEAWNHFESKQRVIDVALLKTRNSIAHTGQTENREDINLAFIVASVLELLELFQAVIENAAAQKLYLFNEPYAAMFG
ncbi:MAG: MAE_28990/MAE_18760 family HEPN-like nuclease [Methylobacter sp.]